MKIKKVLVMVVATIGMSVTLQSSADLQGEMNNWFGGYSNSTPAGAYQSQAGGFYTGGNMTFRVPNRDIGGWASIQPPSFSGGCGGIDLDMGGFNLVNKDEIVQQLRAIGQNAKALAFSMAIGYVSSLLSSKMDQIKSWAQDLNLNQMSSCEAAAGIMALGARATGITQMSTDQVVCMEHKIASGGMTSDQARTACTSGGGGASRRSTVAGLGNVGPFTQGNVAWFAMMHSPWLKNDLNMAEVIMSLTGTIIVRPNDTVSENENRSQIIDVAGSDDGSGGMRATVPYDIQLVVEKMVFGDVEEGFQGDVYVYKCDSANRTNDPSSCTKLANGGRPEKMNWGSITPVRENVVTRVRNIYNAINDPDATLGAQERTFVESTAAPIYRYILSSASAFRRTDPYGDFKLDQYMTAIARGIVAHNLATMMDVIKISMSRDQTNPGNDEKKAEFLKRVKSVQEALVAVRENSEEEMNQILAMQEQSQKYERVIISRMSASMLNSAMFTAR